MFEEIEKLLNIVIAVGLSLIAITFFQLEPNLQKMRAISALDENQKALAAEVSSIKVSLDAVATELEDTKKSQEFVDAVAFAELQNNQRSNEENIRELNSLFTSNPEKARQLHDIRRDYASIKDRVTRLEERAENIHSQLVSGVLSNSSFFSGLALVFVGVFTTLLLQRKSKG